jgi:hypothetical protein
MKVTVKALVAAAAAVSLTTIKYGDAAFIENLGPGVLYIGPDVTTTNGTGFQIPVLVAPMYGVDISAYGGPVYGYASGGNCDVRIIKNSDT